MLRLAFGVLFVQISVFAAPPSQFRVIKEWNYINYTWRSDHSHKTSLTEGYYIPQNNLIAGISFFNGYYYLAIPRMKTGIPVTLARINSANPRSAPLLEPFPSWELNELGNCEALQNVQNVAVDIEGKMWIIDGGKTGTLTKAPNTTCSPKILIYDFKLNQIVKRYNFPEEVANSTVSFLYDLVVDDSDGGYAYITDNSRMDPGLIVFSLKQNASWKIRDSKTMRADPSAITFMINKEIINTPINIAGIALGPKTDVNEQNITLRESRDVFYCPISSLHLYSTRTGYLKSQNFSEGEDGDFSDYIRDVGIKASQTDGMKMDNKGVLYYGLLSTTSIARWDSSTPFSSGQEVISRDSNYIQWPNSFAFDDNGDILVLTNSLEKYVQNEMSLLEPNFRILMAYVDSKSYVYDDDTFAYSIYEMPKQNLTTSTTTMSALLEHEKSTTVKLEKHETTTQGSKSRVTSAKTDLKMAENNTVNVIVKVAPNSGTIPITSILLLLHVCLYMFLN